MKKLPIIILCVIIALGLLFFGIVQGAKNKAITYEEQINESQSAIKVQEKRRADLIPNLVDCVKAYDKHEYETLMAVVEARGVDSDDSVTEIQTMINAVAEAYPELKSNQNYKDLMDELSMTENSIANYRENYNKQVKSYKKHIRSFPTSLFLGIAGYDAIEYEYLNFNVSEDAPTNLFND